MDDPARTDPVVAAAWGLIGQGRPGPKPRLQLGDIVAAAVALADEEGLEAVSMARGPGQEVDDGDEFMLRFGLHRMLDGLQTLVEERRARSGPGPSEDPEP